MSELTKKDKAKAMRNGKLKMAKEGCVWTVEDDLLLRDMFEDGDDVLDMALMLERKEPAVQQRIDQLELYSKQNAPARRGRSLPILPGACVRTARRISLYVPAASIIPEIRRKHDV